MNKIFYINLEKRLDRNRQMLDLLKGQDFERIPAIEDDNGYIGCAYSHILALTIAKERKYPQVTILEDDFMFLEGYSFDTIQGGLPNIPFDILLFCNNIKVTDLLPITDKLIRVRNATWTSGYTIKSTLYDVLIQNLKEGIEGMKEHGHEEHEWIHRPFHLDVYWNKLWKDYIAISFCETIATQRTGYSDILHKSIERRKDQKDSELRRRCRGGHRKSKHDR
jgi:hypothetical protein